MELVIAFALGGLLWQFAEYVIHRFLGHVVKFNNLFKIEHDRHHREVHYFSPLIYKFISAIPISITLISFIQVFTSLEFAITFTIGFIVLYLWYEYLHWSLHISPPRTSYGRFVRKHHFTHHFVSPNINHGVTSPIFDLLFGTYLSTDQVKIPEKVLMKWLVDENNQIRNCYQADYTL